MLFRNGDTSTSHEAMFWERMDGGRVKCRLCAHGCVIPDGGRGICRVRENKGGVLHTLIYGLASSAAIDPIEKKPFFHFKPGTYALSMGTVGCNFRCVHCQNWEISQADPSTFPYLRRYDPADVLKMARGHGLPTVSWTYNEPTVWYEFTLECSKILKKRGIASVYVTNGYIAEDALKEHAPYLDGMNIDVKAFRDEFYRKIVGARLQPVLETVERAHELGIHVELTYLIIPTLNDSDEEIRDFVRWVCDISPEIPVHLSRFHPDYKLTDIPPTPTKRMLRAYEIAKEEGLKYVYLGNFWDPKYESTYCPSCGAMVIERHGYIVRIKGLRGDRCAKCGARLHFVL